MKVKIIRGLAKDMEGEIRGFFDSLPIPSQILNIYLGGDWHDKGIAVAVIVYL